MQKLQSPPCSLLAETRRRLHTDGRTLLDIHKQSGLPFYWLKKLSSGSIRDPSVNRVQQLNEFLTERRLPV